MSRPSTPSPTPDVRGPSKRQRKVDFAIDTAITSTSALKSAATGISSEPLIGASEILMRVLKSVQAARANQDALVSLTNRAIDTLSTLQQRPELQDPDPGLKENWQACVTPLEDALKEILDYVNKNGKRRFLSQAFRSSRVGRDIAELERKLGSAHQLLHNIIIIFIDKSLQEQRRVLNTMEMSLLSSSAGAYVNDLRIYDADEFEVEREIDSTPEFHVYSAKKRADETVMVVQVFSGKDGKERHNAVLENRGEDDLFNSRRVLGTSRPGFPTPYLVLSECETQ